MRKITLIEKRQSARDKAMPDVKKIIKRHGITAVNSCILKLKEHSKKLRELEDMKEQVEKLESEI